jgi:hypothetical protein
MQSPTYPDAINVNADLLIKCICTCSDGEQRALFNYIILRNNVYNSNSVSMISFHVNFLSHLSVAKDLVSLIFHRTP